jgi:hypothetical protein
VIRFHANDYIAPLMIFIHEAVSFCSEMENLRRSISFKYNRFRRYAYLINSRAHFVRPNLIAGVRSDDG